MHLRGRTGARSGGRGSDGMLVLVLLHLLHEGNEETLNREVLDAPKIP